MISIMAFAIDNICVNDAVEEVVANSERLHSVAPHCLILSSYAMAANCVCNEIKKMMTSGGGLGLKFFKIILFQYGTTSEMK